MFIPLCLMFAEQLLSFETPPVEKGWPEIGSRAFINTMALNNEVLLDNGWRIVQPGRYRYLASYSGPTMIRFVLSEYLASAVIW
jgi:hypothetical protein